MNGSDNFPGTFFERLYLEGKVLLLTAGNFQALENTVEGELVQVSGSPKSHLLLRHTGPSSEGLSTLKTQCQDDDSCGRGEGAWGDNQEMKKIDS